MPDDLSVTIALPDLRALNRAIEQIQPGLRKQLMRDAKAVGVRAESTVKRALPSTNPFRQTNSRGRMAWDYQVTKKGGHIPANKTKVTYSSSRSTRKAVTSLLRVEVQAPIMVIADMAGRRGTGGFNSGSRRAPGYSRSFIRNGREIRMRLNGQGFGMVKALGGGSASRFAWPAFTGDQAAYRAEVQAIIQRYINIANRKGL